MTSFRVFTKIVPVLVMLAASHYSHAQITVIQGLSNTVISPLTLVAEPLLTNGMDLAHSSLLKPVAGIASGLVGAALGPDAGLEPISTPLLNAVGKTYGTVLAPVIGEVLEVPSAIILPGLDN
jgi:hypothetical protein